MEAADALKVLLELTRRLGDERVLPAALKLVTDAALRLLPGDHASIRVLDESRTELLSGARSGSGLGKRPVKHQPGRGVAGWVAETGQLARIDDTSCDSRFVVKPNQGFEIKSILAVPLWSAGEVVGVLAVTSKEKALYQTEHEDLAMLLANCAVPPIERARLARLAVTDPQTLVYNHAFLAPALDQQIEQLRGGGGALTVLLMDLDHFKSVNDSYGHPAGDKVLRSFADAVRAMTRDHDVIVRRGGDEFVLIMPATGRQHAEIAAERIRSAVERAPVELGDGNSVAFTVSVGGATWDGSESAGELEKRADDALYLAKREGRNCIRFGGGSTTVPPAGASGPHGSDTLPPSEPDTA